MQQDHIEAAIDQVRHPEGPIKQGLSRLRHDHAIDGYNGAARWSAGFFETIERPEHVGSERQPAGVRLLQSGTVAGYVVAGTSIIRAMQEDEVSPRDDSVGPETSTRGNAWKRHAATASPARDTRRHADVRDDRRLHR